MEINRSRHITYTEAEGQEGREGGRKREDDARKREKVKRKGCMLFAPGEGSD